jgi:hypothetical protein
MLDENPKARLFRIGRTILTSFGVPPKQQGSLIGLWLKGRNDPAAVLAVIQLARDQNVAEPVAYVSAALSGGKNGSGSVRKDWQSGGLACLAAELGTGNYDRSD